MDAQLPHCGGKPWPLHERRAAADAAAGGGGKNRGARRDDEDDPPLEDRPSPVQLVVMATASAADSCHDLKSGFMEQRMQDLILAPPYVGENSASAAARVKNEKDFSVKTTSRDLVSSDNHDLYVAVRWSSLVTLRAVNGFLQASADLAAAASAPINRAPPDSSKPREPVPASPFLIPSFVRVSYVSEENSKVAKWRMHGDFFHPAAWEVCGDSFDATWIPHSLSGRPGVTDLCHGDTEDCGQWWIFFTELQMPTSPEVYANEVSPPPVQGGSNFAWMVTERQRQEVVKGLVCRDGNRKKDRMDCPPEPQAIVPLGDLESFLINFTPNTALGKKHVKGRRPGYGREDEREKDRERVRERNQLHGQEEIEKALFDYTVYPAALFRKDATLKAARGRDSLLQQLQQTSGKKEESDAAGGPRVIKSSYYDVTITKPRPPVLGWCQAAARSGLCTLYADFFRGGVDGRCKEACGLRRDWSPIDAVAE